MDGVRDGGLTEETNRRSSRERQEREEEAEEGRWRVSPARARL